MAKTLMIQGTGSSVGKSLLVAGLCRILHQDGYRVAPFKAQNMALNAAPTPDGLEIGRAQAVQAEAAGIQPTVDMNPILLKPEADNRSQVVVMGRPTDRLNAASYYERKEALWEVVTSALARLVSEYEVIVIEGAGSPAEVNLRSSDIVNMRVALHAQSPVVLVGDIDRGGIFASLLGTLALLAPEERALVKGLVVNKFRGDPGLFDAGVEFLARSAAVPVLGVVPYLHGLSIADEDSTELGRGPFGNGPLDVAVVRVPHTSNYDDFDLLAREPEVTLRFVDAPPALGRPDLIVLPGSKTTMADLDALWASGMAQCIVAQARTGTPVLGICGGYQMLGKRLLDPAGIESERKVARGLGLLPAVTTFAGEKRTLPARAVVDAKRGPLAALRGTEVSGYEIHMGRTDHEGEAPLLLRDGGEVRPEGCLSRNGLVMGSYLHGLFENPPVRRAVVEWLAERRGLSLSGIVAPATTREAEYDRLAQCLRGNLDVKAVYAIVGV